MDETDFVCASPFAQQFDRSLPERLRAFVWRVVGGLFWGNSAYIGSLVYNNEEKGKVPHNREPSPFRLGEIKMGERKYTRKAGKETIQYSQILR